MINSSVSKEESVSVSVVRPFQVTVTPMSLSMDVLDKGPSLSEPFLAVIKIMSSASKPVVISNTRLQLVS